MERARLNRGDAFVNQLRAAIDEARFFGAEVQRLLRDRVVVRLVRLAEIGGIAKTRAPFCFIHSSAALVSSPPEKAMPTFSPVGRPFRIVLIKLPIDRNG